MADKDKEKTVIIDDSKLKEEWDEIVAAAVELAKKKAGDDKGESKK